MNIDFSKLKTVIKNYNLEAFEIIPYCREVFRIETNQGPKALKICSKDEKKMLFIYAAMQYLWDKGFRKLSRPVPTADGKSYALYNGSVYFLTDWLEGRQCDFEIVEDLQASAVTLAQFHKVSHGMETIPDAKARVMSHKWLTTFAERIMDLKEFAAASEKAPTLFGERYLKDYDYYLKQSEAAYEILASSKYPELASEAMEKGFFTHRDIAGRNFIIDEASKEAYLIDFDYSRYDIRITDIVRLLERGLYPHKWNLAVAKTIIDSYNTENPLRDEEYPVLFAFLLWPQKFWRLSDRYFNKKKNWEEESYVRKLNSITKKRKYRERFLKWFEIEYCK